MTDEARKTIRLGDLRNNAVSLPVEAAGATITLDYRPYAITGAFDSALLAAIEAADSQLAVYDAFRAHLPEIVTGWNVTDEADAPIPFTAASLQEIPGPVVQAWYRAIRDHLSPN